MKHLLWLLALTVPLRSAQGGPVLDQAQTALAEGIPQVAIGKLTAALAQNRLPEAERLDAQRLLAEAHLDAGHAEEALAIMQKLPEPTDTGGLLVRAHAEAGAKRWTTALRFYAEVSRRADAPLAAPLGEAECQQALGKTADAVRTLRNALAKREAPIAAHLRLASLYIEADRVDDAKKVLASLKPGAPHDLKWFQHLEARVLLMEKNPKAALALLEPLLADRAGLSENLAAAATLAAAESRLALAGPDVAAKTLETFIRQHPESPQLELIFRRLDQIYEADTNPTEGALHSFFTTLPPRAAALAQFYVTRLQHREKRDDRAQKSLETFLKRFPAHELTADAHKMEAELCLRTGNLAGAERAWDAAARSAKNAEARAEFALNAALINLRQGEFLRASTRLRDAEAFPRLKQSAAYNAALGWLMQQDYPRFRESLGTFAAQFQSPALVGQLRLEEGLLEARTGNGAAMGTLRAFLREFPGHERKTEAQIAMAELAFQQDQIVEAQAFLISAKESTGTPDTTEQAEYLAVFLAGKQHADSAEMIRLGREFISRHPRSPRVSEIRMKLGQAYFSDEDYLKAQEQFESLATADPGNKDYAEAALFLAGQCGMKLINTDALDHALELFDKVAERKGSFGLKARLQQAIIKNKLGVEDDAVKIYDTIIAAPDQSDLEVRHAALVGKGDNLVAMAQKRSGDPVLRQRALNEAVQSYDLLLASKDAGRAWMNQAAYKKGKALVQLGKIDEALLVFNQVLDQAFEGPRETFWYAKAGFDTAGLLEGQQNWKSAIAVYEKMGRVPGQHVPQTQQRAEALRNEHFLRD